MQSLFKAFWIIWSISSTVGYGVESGPSGESWTIASSYEPIEWGGEALGTYEPASAFTLNDRGPILKHSILDLYLFDNGKEYCVANEVMSDKCILTVSYSMEFSVFDEEYGEFKPAPHLFIAHEEQMEYYNQVPDSVIIESEGSFSTKVSS